MADTSNIELEQGQEGIIPPSSDIDLRPDAEQPEQPLDIENSGNQQSNNLIAPSNPSTMSSTTSTILKWTFIILAIPLVVGSMKFISNMLPSSNQHNLLSFDEYRSLYGKQYATSDQQNYRELIYYRKIQEILKHNSADSNYKLGITEFSDITEEQFRNVYLLIKEIAAAKKYITIDEDDDSVVEQMYTEEHRTGEVYPDVDWTHLLPDIKNQYQCAGCYSFPVTASVEALYALAYNETISLSEQQLIDCTSQLGKGCQDGSITRGYKHIVSNGINLEKDYKYRSKNGDSFECKAPKSNKFKITKVIDIPSGKCHLVEKALQKGPVVAKIDASNWGQYREGVFDNCGRFYNHGVLIVGHTKEYWLVRNSWGKNWGQYGHIKLAKGNTCGLCDAACFPINGTMKA